MHRRLVLHSALATGLAAPFARAQAQSIQELPRTTVLAPLQAADLEGRKLPAPGRATIVNFWATWCAPCLVEMPLLQQVADFYGDRLTLQAVNVKERAVAVQKHVRNADWKVPVLVDPFGEGAQAWGVKVFPTTFGFDARGRARWRVTGGYDWSSPAAGKLIEGLWA